MSKTVIPIYDLDQGKILGQKQNLKTFSTRIVAGELTTDSLRLAERISDGSSRGLLDADVATAKAAAAVDVLLL